MIVLAFSAKNSSLISRAIKFVTRWKHSHVALLSPDGQFYAESTGDQFYDAGANHMRDGVRMVSIANLMSRDDVELRTIWHPHPELVWEHAVSLIGSRYDRKYPWGWLINNDKLQDSDKYSCDELIRVAMRRAGHDPFPESVKQTSPRDFYLKSEALPKE